MISLFTNKSKLNLLNSKGAQILELKFLNKNGDWIEVIDGYKDSEDFFFSGSFLMFPWVNRLESTEYPKGSSLKAHAYDGNGYAIHGSVFKAYRNIITFLNTKVELKISETIETFPEVTEIFSLKENLLEIETIFFNSSNNPQYFAYGYHPYIKIGNFKIDNLIFETNCSDNISLGKNYLPTNPISKIPIQDILVPGSKINNLSLDHLFVNSKGTDAYIKLISKDLNIGVEISTVCDSECAIPNPFFQVYTPSHRNSIAIEPMNSIGNAFFINGAPLTHLSPGEKKSGKFQIRFIE